MTLRPASLINLKPYVKSFEDEDVKMEKEMSYGEKYKELAMKFGANRIQKTLRGYYFMNFVIAVLKGAILYSKTFHFPKPRDALFSDWISCFVTMCVLTGKDRVKEMESNTLDEAMQEAVASVDTSNLTEQADLHHNDILPPINTEAKVTRCFNY